jgi:hypothetical protein
MYVRPTLLSGSPFTPLVDDRNFAILSHCLELRELEIVASRLTDAHLNLVSSITSSRIEKITLDRSPAFMLPAGHTYWTRLDEVFVRLVGRREYKAGLEVVFAGVVVAWDGKLDLGKYLPMFVEKGRMVVLDTKRRSIYRSDEAREKR